MIYALLIEWHFQEFVLHNVMWQHSWSIVNNE